MRLNCLLFAENRNVFIDDSMDDYTDLEFLEDELPSSSSDDVASSSQLSSAVVSPSPINSSAVISPSAINSSTPSGSTPRCTAKKKKNRDDAFDKIMKKIEELDEKDDKDKKEQRKWEDKMYQLELEKKTYLEKLAGDSEDMKTAVISFLRKRNN